MFVYRRSPRVPRVAPEVQQRGAAVAFAMAKLLSTSADVPSDSTNIDAENSQASPRRSSRSQSSLGECHQRNSQPNMPARPASSCPDSAVSSPHLLLPMVASLICIAVQPATLKIAPAVMARLAAPTPPRGTDPGAGNLSPEFGL